MRLVRYFKTSVKHMCYVDNIRCLDCRVQERIFSFTVSYIYQKWEFRINKQGISTPDFCHNGKDLSEMFIRKIRQLELDRDICFITTEQANAAKRQVRLSIEERSIL